MSQVMHVALVRAIAIAPARPILNGNWTRSLLVDCGGWHLRLELEAVHRDQLAIDEACLLTDPAGPAPEPKPRSLIARLCGGDVA